MMILVNIFIFICLIVLTGYLIYYLYSRLMDVYLGSFMSTYFLSELGKAYNGYVPIGKNSYLVIREVDNEDLPSVEMLSVSFVSDNVVFETQLLENFLLRGEVEVKRFKKPWRKEIESALLNYKKTHNANLKARKKMKKMQEQKEYNALVEKYEDTRQPDR